MDAIESRMPKTEVGNINESLETEAIPKPSSLSKTIINWQVMEIYQL